MTQEILHKIDEKRLAKNTQEKYKQLNKEIRKMCREAEEEYLEECWEEIEELEKKDAQMMHKKVRHATLRRKRSLTGCIKDEDGSFLMMKSQSSEDGLITTKVSVLMMEGKKKQR